MMLESSRLPLCVGLIYLCVALLFVPGYPGGGNYVDVHIPANAWGHCELNSKHSHCRARAQGLVDDKGATCSQTMHCRQTTQ